VDAEWPLTQGGDRWQGGKVDPQALRASAPGRGPVAYRLTQHDRPGAETSYHYATGWLLTTAPGQRPQASAPAGSRAASRPLRSHSRRTGACESSPAGKPRRRQYMASREPLIVCQKVATAQGAATAALR